MTDGHYKSTQIQRKPMETNSDGKKLSHVARSSDATVVLVRGLRANEVYRKLTGYVLSHF